MSHVMKTPNLSLFLGRRNTGKSTLMIHLLRTLAKAQKFAWVRVYSPTAFTGVWGNIVGEDNVEAVFDSEELEEILESQASIRSRGGKNEGLVILDDCLGACSFQNAHRVQWPPLWSYFLGLSATRLQVAPGHTFKCGLYVFIGSAG